MSQDSIEFLFSTPAMTEIFSLSRQLRAMMQFEWALSGALEECGLAEAGSPNAVKPHLDAQFVDLGSLRSEALNAGNVAIPFIHQLTAKVKAENEGAAKTIHLGATSQDVLDTALILQIQDALQLLLDSVQRLDHALAKQARIHAQTLITARTWLQPGPPTTFGLKLAGFVSALRRHRARIHQAAQRGLVLQFGGAVGTLAALGAHGARVSSELARILNLAEPDLPWHSHRDNLVEIAATLALLVGTLGKFARDIALLMQAEVGEASEPAQSGRGGSSTMPHKRNPVACAAVLACSTRVPGLVATLLAAMPQEHERGLGLWPAEWETIPEIFRLTACALARSIEIAEGLEVDAARMAANLDARQGLTQSEAVVVALTAKIGRSAAHSLLEAAARKATATGQHLSPILKSIPEVTAHLSGEEIDRLLDPRGYLGSAARFIHQALEDADAGH
jgi:3-carboxy-cis,cis-muconate cycloisomerase